MGEVVDEVGDLGGTERVEGGGEEVAVAVFVGGVEEGEEGVHGGTMGGWD